MAVVVIAAHGQLAQALKESTEMIMGQLDGVAAVTFAPGQGPDDLLEAYRAAAGDEPAIFLVDLLGGSPYNAAARYAAAHDNTDVVTGVNMPMVIEVVSKAQRGEALEGLVAAAEAAGGAGIRSFRTSFTPPASAGDSDEGDEL